MRDYALEGRLLAIENILCLTYNMMLRYGHLTEEQITNVEAFVLADTDRQASEIGALSKFSDDGAELAKSLQNSLADLQSRSRALRESSGLTP